MGGCWVRQGVLGGGWSREGMGFGGWTVGSEGRGWGLEGGQGLLHFTLPPAPHTSAHLAVGGNADIEAVVAAHGILPALQLLLALFPKVGLRHVLNQTLDHARLAGLDVLAIDGLLFAAQLVELGSGHRETGKSIWIYPKLT